ncbi:MAG: DUF669 domain-containing protein [Cellulosilyticaceae bacterium]
MGFDFTAGAGASTETAGVVANSDAEGMVFDLTGVEEDKKFEIIPKGTYDAVVDELDFGESKSGNPMITVKYSLTSPEYENRVIFDYWVLKGKGDEFGLAKLKKFLVRVCPDINLATFNPKTFADTGEAVGRACQLTLGIQTQKQGEYKGEKRNTVKDLLAASSGSFLG